MKTNDSAVEATADQSDRKLANSQQSGWSRREGNHGAAKKVTLSLSRFPEECCSGTINLY